MLGSIAIGAALAMMLQWPSPAHTQAQEKRGCRQWEVQRMMMVLGTDEVTIAAGWKPFAYGKGWVLSRRCKAK